MRAARPGPIRSGDAPRLPEGGWRCNSGTTRTKALHDLSLPARPVPGLSPDPARPAATGAANGAAPDAAPAGSIGVVVVAYDAGEALLDCLESLLAAAGTPGAPDLRVLVVDNASPDGTLGRLEGWASGAVPWDGADGSRDLPFAPRPRGPVRIDARDLAAAGRHASLGTAAEGVVGFLQAGTNGGFAAGVNRGLETFRAMPEVDWFWILNPDAACEAGTPAALARAARAAEAAGGFAVIGGRTFYADPPLMIQTDGGRVDLATGRLLPFNLGATGRDVPGPEEGALEYVPGCHMLASRAFLDRAGLMPEDYFLYYEEVDWCFRRGDLPLIWTAGAPVHHVSGASIGSATLESGPSALAAYWMTRSRLRFVRRWRPRALPKAAAYSAFKAAQMARRGNRAGAAAALRALAGRMPAAAGLDAGPATGAGP